MAIFRNELIAKTLFSIFSKGKISKSDSNPWFGILFSLSNEDLNSDTDFNCFSICSVSTEGCNFCIASFPN